MSKNTDYNSPEDVLPQKVVAKLKEVSAAQVDVPASVDQQILADARAVLADSRAVPRRFTARRWAAGFAVAGSLTAALVVAFIGPWNDNSELSMATRSVEPSAMSEIEESVGNTSADAGSSEAMTAPGNEILLTSIRDVDRDGRVDILDAFALARQMSASPTNAQGDQNGDGVVNDEDIQLVARTAVTL